MRVRAITALALATAVSAGCGGIVNGCTKAAVKVGSTAPAKVGIGAATKGAALLAPDVIEGAARTAGHAAGEAEGARLTGMPSQLRRSAKSEPERSRDDVGISHSPWKTVTERAKDAYDAKDIAERLDLLNAAPDNDRERRDDRRKN